VRVRKIQRADLIPRQVLSYKRIGHPLISYALLGDEK